MAYPPPPVVPDLIQNPGPAVARTLMLERRITMASAHPLRRSA